MDLLEFAIQTQEYLDSINNNSFAKEFVRLRCESFRNYHWYLNNKKEKQYLVTISLGLDYFKTIIKYWNEPEKFISDQNIIIDKEYDYNINFVEVLNLNKHRSYEN